MLLHEVYVSYIAACHMWVRCLNMYVYIYIYFRTCTSPGMTMYSSLAAVKCGCIPVHLQLNEIELWYRFL